MLPQLSISDVTVGGFSYGGDMAIQTHIAYSSMIKGICGFAAQPFYCGITQFTREGLIAQHKNSGVPNCDGIFGCGDVTTLEFDHCRAHPEIVDIGRLPDFPRRHCG
jgi:hypothetical protein